MCCLLLSLKQELRSTLRAGASGSTASTGTGSSGGGGALKAGELVRSLPTFPLNLGVSELHSPPRILYLYLHNPAPSSSPLSATFRLKLPEDSEVALDLWASSGNPSKEERWQHAIVDGQLFAATPRVATVKPVRLLCVLIVCVCGGACGRLGSSSLPRSCALVCWWCRAHM
jgi:hypothetical protein